KKRGRSYEQPTETNGLEDYYRLLHNHYQEWYDKYDYSPKMLIKTDNIDITCDDDWQQVFGQIKDKMQELGI
ncbi:deoxynucleoside kinase, partial [Streptococcus suis]